MKQVYENRKWVSPIIATNVVLYILICLFFAPMALLYTVMGLVILAVSVGAIFLLTEFISELIEEVHQDKDN